MRGGRLIGGREEAPLRLVGGDNEGNDRDGGGGGGGGRGGTSLDFSIVADYLPIRERGGLTILSRHLLILP